MKLNQARSLTGFTWPTETLTSFITVPTTWSGTPTTTIVAALVPFSNSSSDPGQGQSSKKVAAAVGSSLGLLLLLMLTILGFMHWRNHRYGVGEAVEKKSMVIADHALDTQPSIEPYSQSNPHRITWEDARLSMVAWIKRIHAKTNSKKNLYNASSRNLVQDPAKCDVQRSSASVADRDANITLAPSNPIPSQIGVAISSPMIRGSADRPNNLRSQPVQAGKSPVDKFVNQNLESRSVSPLDNFDPSAPHASPSELDLVSLPEAPRRPKLYRF